MASQQDSEVVAQPGLLYNDMLQMLKLAKPTAQGCPSATSCDYVSSNTEISCSFSHSRSYSTLALKIGLQATLDKFQGPDGIEEELPLSTIAWTSTQLTSVRAVGTKYKIVGKLVHGTFSRA